MVDSYKRMSDFINSCDKFSRSECADGTCECSGLVVDGNPCEVSYYKRNYILNHVKDEDNFEFWLEYCRRGYRIGELTLPMFLGYNVSETLSKFIDRCDEDTMNYVTGDCFSDGRGKQTLLLTLINHEDTFFDHPSDAKISKYIEKMCIKLIKSGKSNYKYLQEDHEDHEDREYGSAYIYAEEYGFDKIVDEIRNAYENS